MTHPSSLPSRGAVPHLPEGVTVNDQPDPVVYIMQLEELIRWLALPYSYEDPASGELVVNDPIWPTEDGNGEAMPVNIRLAATWAKVMHDA